MHISVRSSQDSEVDMHQLQVNHANINVVVLTSEQQCSFPEREDFTCFGQPTRLITCARTQGPDKALMSMSHSHLSAVTYI